MLSSKLRIAIILMKQLVPVAIQKLHLLLVAGCMVGISACTSPVVGPEFPEFNAQRAFQDLNYQVQLGPRIAGSSAHQQVRNWLVATNENAGWVVEEQSINYQGQDIRNIIVKRDNSSDFPWIIIGAHYDSRVIADKDPLPENRAKPVPGANDGASGVAILNELARVLPTDLQASIWLVYFDAEDNGSMPGGEWILGSRAFVDSLQVKPDAVVIVDMVGDQDLNIFIEKNSTEELAAEIWRVAESLGYEKYFINQAKYQIVDDHLPFIQAGIAAVDIIDFDYQYWHTISDTVDKVSAESLGIVGEVVLEWLIREFDETR